ncbi:hypothetical protein [Pseudomonas sp. S9]|uniref:hypothetical protein n=1 Tax=Pseudomonas sp. S9 TaxID=686578 RepID=UPI0002556DA5|nr:hypothetical protein [Pseudomonas sp. S9]
MRIFMRVSLCCFLGAVLSLFLLIGLMFFRRFDLISGLTLTGMLLSWLVLNSLPADFLSSLTGGANASSNPSVQSFAQLCAALGQLAVLLGGGFYYYWYRR